MIWGILVNKRKNMLADIYLFVLLIIGFVLFAYYLVGWSM